MDLQNIIRQMITQADSSGFEVRLESVLNEMFGKYRQKKEICDKMWVPYPGKTFVVDGEEFVVLQLFIAGVCMTARLSDLRQAWEASVDAPRCLQTQIHIFPKAAQHAREFLQDPEEALLLGMSDRFKEGAMELLINPELLKQTLEENGILRALRALAAKVIKEAQVLGMDPVLLMSTMEDMLKE